MNSSYLDISFYVSIYIQDEYRRLYVLLFVLLFTVTVISYLLLRDVLLRLQVTEEFLFLSARQRAYIITGFQSINNYPPFTASIGYLHLTARAYIRVVIFTIFILILSFVSLLPFFRWLPVRLG